MKTDICTVFIISHLFILKIGNVSDRSCGENKKNTFFIYLENLLAYQIMWNNILEPCRPQMTILRMRIACWVPKATHTHTPTTCNTHCFPTTTTVARTHLNVTIYVHCLSCFSVVLCVHVSTQTIYVYVYT